MLIEITGVTSGQSPYDIFLCTTGNPLCFFVSGNTTIPPSIVINSEDYFPGIDTLSLKLIDTNGCVHEEIVDCSDPCTYYQWQITIGGPCAFELYDCDLNVYDIVTYTSPGIYYACSAYQPGGTGICALPPSPFVNVGLCSP